MEIINCHTHIFTFDHVPKKFLPFGLVRYLGKNERSRKLARFLSKLFPWSDRDVLDRFATFVKQGYAKKQEDILDSLLRFYPEGTKFVILPMDMEKMGAGMPRETYLVQMQKLLELKEDKKYKNVILPFVFADPRREGVFNHVREYIEQYGFSGIKIYPPLGYYPFDAGLDEVYKYAEENQIPIMTHCSPPVVFYKGRIKRSWLKHPISGEKLKRERKKKFARNWTDPDNYREVFRKYPNLKLCFGHFGGSSQWEDYFNHTTEEEYKKSWFYKIKLLLLEYPNAFADVSYSLAEKDLYPILNLLLVDDRIKNKILFGSDFYMANIEGREFKFSVSLRHAIGEDNFRLIAVENPKKYLGIE